MKSTIVVTVVLCTLAGQALADDMSAEPVATAKWMMNKSRAWSDQGLWRQMGDLRPASDDFHGKESLGELVLGSFEPASGYVDTAVKSG